ncbi:hypothetical protein ACHAW5_007599 [Stephanodiscus triporus]|uniref:Uncharacterized protein n=1 Tax=Stephanodiscus triporus TaxID=2934178 RepID=A0ABD3MU31_9STRA
MEGLNGNELCTDFDESFHALPRFANDENYSMVRDIAVEDEDVLMLYEDGDNGLSDSDSDELSVDNSILGPGSLASFMLGSGGDRLRAAHIHPSEWFHAFRDENFKDHFPSAATEISENVGDRRYHYESLASVMMKCDVLVTYDKS